MDLTDAFQTVLPSLVSAAVGLLVGSLKRNVREVDEKIGKIAETVTTLANQSNEHARKLERIEDKVHSVDREVQSLLGRERDRACFGRCQVLAQREAHTDG